MSLFRKITFCGAAFFALCAVIPLFYGLYNIGSVVLLLMSVLSLLFPWIWQLSCSRKTLRAAIVTAYTLGIVVILGLSVQMLWQAYANQPPIMGKQTLIVLGAGLHGNEPSRMLAYRLNKAAGYLAQNPDAVCIVSGGQGDDEIIPEAQAMTNYLIRKGVSSERIIQEAASRNTRQNLRFSQQLVPAGSEGIVIVTDNFHQSRATITAKALGMQPLYNLSSFPPIGLLPMYWMRDLPGIPLTWLEENIWNPQQS